MSDLVDDRYRLFMLTRATVAGMRLKVGSTLFVPTNRLQVAAHLVATGAARPADARTALDVELYRLLPAAPKL